MDYSTCRQAEVLFNLNDLQKVQIKNGNIEGFVNSWGMVIEGMKRVPDEDTLQFVFYESAKSWRGIAEDIVHCERQDEDSGGDRSYQYLRNAVDRFIRREKQKKVREDLGKAISGGGEWSSSNRPAAPAAGETGESRGRDRKGDGKGTPKHGDRAVQKA